MTDLPDDLQQILGYQGAIDERIGVHSMSDEILVVPFWKPSFCATVIRAAEAVGAFEPQPGDPVPGHEVSLALISPRLFEAVEIDLGRRIWPQMQQVWPYIDYSGLRDVFVIRYAMGEQEHLRMHHDIAQVSGSVKLNDGYDGAVLDFPRQHVTNEPAGIGEMIAWPSLVTHPHQTTPLRSGIKYALTIWFELPTF
ncbi:MAG: hypothetical protein LH616_00145 [Ilumatobacteraceae bacterium]|nr:hypothetical protein [Ilumatobacteraceae bacterium]